MLFPHAALHHTISSVSDSNLVKQIGQSPETSLRFEGDSVDAEISDEAGAGAAANISCNSLTHVSEIQDSVYKTESYGWQEC